MKQKFTAMVWREGDLYVAQCVDFDVTSQGESEQQALLNLGEALQLYSGEPAAGAKVRRHCKVATIEIEVS